jgi:hypothetical protein
MAGPRSSLKMASRIANFNVHQFEKVAEVDSLDTLVPIPLITSLLVT